MRRAAFLLLAGAAAACASPSEIPPAETPFLRAKLEEAAALGAAAPVPAFPAPAAAPAAAPRADRLDATAGIVDLAAPPVAEFVARLSDAASAAAAVAATPLDTDLVLAAVWARNPAVAAARADVESARRVYEQASWLDDVETRFRSAGLPAANVRAAMEAAPLAYPSAAALRGEMLDREVAMAAARLRAAFLDAGAGALDAFHTAVHHEGEVAIRREQVAVISRLVEASRARVESGRAPQAEILEAEAELAMSRSDLEHALSALGAARSRFATFVDLPPGSAFSGAPHADPPETPPDAAALVALAHRWSPMIAMARAEAARAEVAERMARRMAVPTPAPGAAGMGAEPMASAPEVSSPAWAAELASRSEAAGRRAEESVRETERMVADMTYELTTMARMHRVAKTAAEPATRQALDERMRLYETGRGDFAAVLAAAKRHLDAQHDVVTAFHDYRGMEARLWRTVGARPDLADGDRR